jgi:mannose-6-phosphate isomerase-like protein (cupin superfamily)
MAVACAALRMTESIEVPVRHRCHLGELTDALAQHARRGEHGDRLAERARSALERLLASDDFATCCVPAYVAVAPKVFERELQVPVASADEAGLDARVLLWPVGAKDGQHPHADGWAVFAVARGTLAVHERRGGERQPEREVVVGEPEVLTPRDGVTHHIHNRGDEVALSVHVFGN